MEHKVIQDVSDNIFELRLIFPLFSQKDIIQNLVNKFCYGY